MKNLQETIDYWSDLFKRMTNALEKNADFGARLNEVAEICNEKREVCDERKN